MTYKYMEAFVDEAGALEANEPFVAGIWLTAHSQMWRNIITERRNLIRYGYSMHFNEISRKATDWQFRLVRKIFMDLRRVRHSWYARMLHVNPYSLKAWGNLSMQDKYDNLIAELILKFAPRAYAENITIFISNRPRPVDDDFLPNGLEKLLNKQSKKQGGPQFSVKLKSHKEDDLLQLADLLTSGIRQLYYRSANKNKCKLAELLQPLIDDRIFIWEWQ